MLFLGSQTPGMGFNPSLSGCCVYALAVGAPAVAGATECPVGMFLGCSVRGGREAVGVVHDRYADEIVLSQPEYIDVADTYAEVLPGYGLVPIPL